MMTDDEQVRAAAGLFYEALVRVCNGDSSLMREAWDHGDDVTIAHPMGEWVKGWAQISVSWDELAIAITKGSVGAKILDVRVLGDVAYAIGVEDATITIGGREARFHANATNIFRRKDGVWKMIHHHADRAPSAEAAIDQLAT